jgi:hypothetical protein
MGRARETHPRVVAGVWGPSGSLGVVRAVDSIAFGEFDTRLFGVGPVENGDMANHTA